LGRRLLATPLGVLQKGIDLELQEKTLEKLRNLINEETEYRSGPQLVSFFNSLGFNDEYGQGFPSRWMYTDECLSRLNGSSKIGECILKVLAPVNFIGRIDELDKFIDEFNEYLSFDGYKIQRKGKTIEIFTSDEDLTVETNENVTEDEFLNKEFDYVKLESLGLDSVITEALSERIDEIKKCLSSKASLALIFLAGSTLEGILLGIATKSPKEFNKSNVSPKDSDGKVLQFHKWTLNDFINVAYDLDLLKEDVKKFSHSLRDFRNYIHPFEQVSSRFSPDEHTARICWQVLKAAIHQLSKKDE